MKRLFPTLVFGLLGVACAGSAPRATVPEYACLEKMFYDFPVGTVATYCEPSPGRIIIYEHTYPNGFSIFDPNGDGAVDRYCNLHRCVKRAELDTLPKDRRRDEQQFFETWDDVLKSLPESILRSRP